MYGVEFGCTAQREASKCIALHHRKSDIVWMKAVKAVYLPAGLSKIQDDFQGNRGISVSVTVTNSLRLLSGFNWSGESEIKNRHHPSFRLRQQQVSSSSFESVFPISPFPIIPPRIIVSNAVHDLFVVVVNVELEFRPIPGIRSHVSPSHFPFYFLLCST